jgi:hypothetical protein
MIAMSRVVAANCGGRSKQQNYNWDPYKYAPAQKQNTNEHPH